MREQKGLTVCTGVSGGESGVSTRVGKTVGRIPAMHQNKAKTKQKKNKKKKNIYKKTKKKICLILLINIIKQDFESLDDAWLFPERSDTADIYIHIPNKNTHTQKKKKKVKKK
jgi:hypothetical protein